MNYLLFEQHRESLFPLTLTRPVGEMRVGILTLREKWEKRLNQTFGQLAVPYLHKKYPVVIESDNILVNANVIATDALARDLQKLQPNEALFSGVKLVAIRLNGAMARNYPAIDWKLINHQETNAICDVLEFPEQIFIRNPAEIVADFALLTTGRTSAPLSDTNRCLAAHNIFVEPGAEVELAILDAREGPIYIGEDASIQPGAIVAGPFALCTHSQVKMGAKVHSGSTFGPYCKVGGETQNVVLFGYSNKGHDGYLGNAVLGEWCNLGADTNNSNLKNDYTQVRIWDYTTESFRRTGLQFCGTIMGDHSKTGINTMLNTGTVIGICANIFGAGFPRQFVPSFAWGGAHGFQVYQLKKAIETAKLVMQRRNIEFTEADREIFQTVFDITAHSRSFS